jgi:type IV pilus assembly protein PilV
MRHTPQTHQVVAAFTLVEVLVTLAITTIGLVGLNAMMLEANRAAIDASSRSQAAWMAEDLRNRIKANRSAIGFYDTGGEQACSDISIALVCADYYDGSSKVSAVACTPQELAQYDIWDTFCGRDITITNSDFVKVNPSDFISNPKLSVSVTPIIGSNQSFVTIDLSWASRTGVATDQYGNRVYVSDTDLMPNDTQITSRRDSITLDFIP